VAGSTNMLMGPSVAQNLRNPAEELFESVPQNYKFKLKLYKTLITNLQVLLKFLLHNTQ
jgi:hypothetical protein